MNPAVIVLGVILVLVIFYMIYSSYFSSTAKLAGELHLLTTPNDVKSEQLSKADATRYAYGIWIYVNRAPTATDQCVFSRKNDMTLFMNSGHLKVAINPGTVRAITGANVINITNNFPIQKWVHVVISIDNTIADIYLDGKLVKSVAITQVMPPAHVENGGENIVFGNTGTTGWDAYISNFERTTVPLDPQSVWNMYMKGSGSSFSTAKNAVGNYNLNLSLLKDGKLSQKYKLF